VARSTRCTVDSGPSPCTPCATPPSKSTCPAALSLSSTAIAAAAWIRPHDSGGRATNAPSSGENISTLEVLAPPEPHPPTTTRVPLTAQHAGLKRAVTRPGMPPHRSVARFSLHTSLTTPPLDPPHTTSPGRVLRNSFAPNRAALHTRISLHAPTSPRCTATRAHTSGRPVARSTVQLASSSGAARGVAMVLCCGEVKNETFLSLKGRSFPSRLLFELQVLRGTFSPALHFPRTPPPLSARRAHTIQRCVPGHTHTGALVSYAFRHHASPPTTHALPY
jgi:hypothetical protein